MNVIEEVRREREDLARVLKKYKGIRKSVEDLYPDRAHFIYELLQNAEDAGATEVSFTLQETKLVFEHNGRPFERKDIEGITNIGEGTKAGDEDKIGCFGVGFKAVFAYCETPHIWSKTFSFKITDFVLPSKLPTKAKLGEKTRFEFPFDNPKKLPADAYGEIELGLNHLADTALLFLANLKSIRWQIGRATQGTVARVQYPKNHVEVSKSVNGEQSQGSHFLCFDQFVPGHTKLRVAIAFELGFLKDVKSFQAKKMLAKQMKIVSANPGRVAVFFPAAKESSGLRFHVHAPFVPTVDRASLKDTPANGPLFTELAQLTATSLSKIRDLGLLTFEFLGVLPNSGDRIEKPYDEIQVAIVDEMKTKSLVPTHCQSHAPAFSLLQGHSSLKQLLPDIGEVYHREGSDGPVRWVASVPPHRRSYHFLNDLEIDKCDVADFVQLLIERTTDNGSTQPDPDFMGWLAAKSPEWHQRLYAMIRNDIHKWP